MEENFSKLPNQVYESALRDLIKTRLGHDEYELRVGAGSKKGDNALGIIYRIEVISKGVKEFSLILKVSPQNLARRKEFLTHEIFNRETEFYDEIFPMFKKFQEMKGIDVEAEGFHHVAACFKSFTNEPFEGQIFEDLSEKGFQLYDRKKQITKEHVILVMKALAKMHATFLCLKDQNPEMVLKYKKMEELLMKIFNVQNSACLAWHRQECERALDVLKSCKNKDLVDRVHKLLYGNVMKQFEEALSGEDAEPFAVLCHGDCWNNNLLYKSDNSGRPIDIRMLDFQLMRYASPATDLGYYIFGCTTKKLRNEHYQEFLDVYYETLQTFIKRLGSCPEKVFPRSALNDQMRKFAKFGLLQGVMLIAAFVSDNKDAPDMDTLTTNFAESGDDRKFTFISEKTANVFQQRIMEAFQDMYDLGYI